MKIAGQLKEKNIAERETQKSKKGTYVSMGNPVKCI